MNTILLLIVLLLYTTYIHALPTNNNDDKIIALDYQLFLNALSVFIKVGSNKEILIFTIDTESPHSRISDYLFIGGSSSCKEHGNITFTLPTGTITAELVEETLIIEDPLWLDVIAEVPGFYFGVVKTQDVVITDSSVLAFAFNVDKANYSIVHLYKQEGIITKKQFGIYRNKDIIYGDTTSKGGVAYIGGFPTNITNSLYENAIHVVNSGKYNYWSVPLQYVFIGEISYMYTNKYYEVNTISYVSTAREDIVVPKQFYQEYIVNYYFKEAFVNNVCVLKNHTDYTVTCQCEYITSFDSVSFVINGKDYVIESKYLFKRLETACTFIISQHVDEDDNSWILGVYFIWQYQTLFDYDGKRVVLYSDKEINNIDLNALFPGKKIFKTFMIMISIIIIISISCGVIRYIKRRKLRKMNNVMKTFYKKINDNNI